MLSLTYLSLPPARLLTVLGLLWAASGMMAPAQGPSTLDRSGGSARVETGGERLQAFFVPGISDLGPAGYVSGDPGPALPTFRRRPDGTTAVTIHWDRNDGESVEQRSAVLILAPNPIPEPPSTLLGACAGCVFLLYRRRAEPSKLRPARVNLSAAFCATRRVIPPTAARSRRPVLAPREPRVPRRHRPGSSHAAYIGRLFPRQPRLSRP